MKDDTLNCTWKLGSLHPHEMMFLWSEISHELYNMQEWNFDELSSGQNCRQKQHILSQRMVLTFASQLIFNVGITLHRN